MLYKFGGHRQQDSARPFQLDNLKELFAWPWRNSWAPTGPAGSGTVAELPFSLIDHLPAQGAGTFSAYGKAIRGRFPVPPMKFCDRFFSRRNTSKCICPDTPMGRACALWPGDRANAGRTHTGRGALKIAYTLDNTIQRFAQIELAVQDILYGMTLFYCTENHLRKLKIYGGDPDESHQTSGRFCFIMSTGWLPGSRGAPGRYLYVCRGQLKKTTMRTDTTYRASLSGCEAWDCLSSSGRSS